MSDLTHFDAEGRARMVDVGAKPVSERVALAEGFVFMPAATLALIGGGGVPKGDVLGTARLAGIMAAKKTADLIPLCHPLPLSAVTLDLVPEPEKERLRIEASVRTRARTGVEMEALTAVSVAALTVYDMVKASGHAMRIGGIRLLMKDGGRTGPYRADDADAG